MSINNTFDFLIQWHLTEKCNFRCRHCYQTGDKNGDMTTSEIIASLNEISETFHIWNNLYDIDFKPSFNITGGEPLLRKDLFEILSELSVRGYETYLLTNGALLNKERTERLYDLGIRGIQISIEGPEDVHDSIRGKGSFSASVRGLRNAVEKGIEVTLNATLSALNAVHFADIVSLAANTGAAKVGFSRLVPSGTGRDLVNEMLSSEEVKYYYEKLFSVNPDSVQIVTGDPVASQMRETGDGSNIPMGGCAAGISGLTIMPDGTLLPCRRLPVPVGNIRKDPLREVWACSDVLNSLRDRSRYKGSCRVCKRWANCRGCRAIAFAYSGIGGEGDILAEDPQCFLQ